MHGNNPERLMMKTTQGQVLDRNQVGGINKHENINISSHSEEENHQYDLLAPNAATLVPITAAHHQMLQTPLFGNRATNNIVVSPPVLVEQDQK